MTKPTTSLSDLIAKAAEKAGERAAEKAKERRVVNPVKAEDKAGSEINLIKPDAQDITDYGISWKWHVGENDPVTVRAMLLIAGDPEFDLKAGDYVVWLNFGVEPDSSFILQGESPKSIGELLLSAYYWQNEWKQHAGDFLLQSLQQGTKDQGTEGNNNDVDIVGPII